MIFCLRKCIVFSVVQTEFVAKMYKPVMRPLNRMQENREESDNIPAHRCSVAVSVPCPHAIVVICPSTSLRAFVCHYSTVFLAASPPVILYNAIG